MFNIPSPQVTRLVCCSLCGSPLEFGGDGSRCCCGGANGARFIGPLLEYEEPNLLPVSTEMQARDRQAAGYLQHAKFPTQIDRVRRFLERHKSSDRSLPVLDLGCGPGPTTNLLLRAGYDVIAVDFSRASLLINAEHCREESERVLFVRADLKRIKLVERSFGGLMMADFIQHLGGLEDQRRFLQTALTWLAPGGWFYLSAFNANVKNILRRDIEGSFANGAIRYRRNTRKEALSLLPADVRIESSYAMNLFHSPTLDRWASKAPLAHWFGRMIGVEGRKL